MVSEGRFENTLPTFLLSFCISLEHSRSSSLLSCFSFEPLLSHFLHLNVLNLRRFGCLMPRSASFSKLFYVSKLNKILSNATRSSFSNAMSIVVLPFPPRSALHGPNSEAPDRMLCRAASVYAGTAYHHRWYGGGGSSGVAGTGSLLLHRSLNGFVALDSERRAEYRI